MRFRGSFLLLVGSLLVLSGAGWAGPGLSARAGAKPQQSSSPQTAPSTPASTNNGADGQPGAAPLTVPVDEIVRRFSQHESDFKLARDNYTYTQEVLVEDVAPNHGEYRITTDVVFTPEGHRYEHDTYSAAASKPGGFRSLARGHERP